MGNWDHIGLALTEDLLKPLTDIMVLRDWVDSLEDSSMLENMHTNRSTPVHINRSTHASRQPDTYSLRKSLYCTG